MQQNMFKTYQRGRRQSVVDTTFTNGMMFTNGAVDENYLKTIVNYDIKKEGDTLVPRAGLRLSELILDHNLGDTYPYSSNPNVRIFASRDCVHEGETYRQFILGDPEENKMWSVLSGKPEEVITNDPDSEVPFEVGLALSKVRKEGYDCSFLTAPLEKVHGMPVAEGNVTASIVGTFAFGNDFYFIDPNEGLRRTVIENTYGPIASKVQPKELDPSEAVTFGYNMLAGEDSYSFINENLEGTIQLTGILPYSAKKPNTLLLTPHHNEDIILRCYFKGQAEREYKFVWEWRNVGDDDWTVLQSKEQSPTYKITPVSGDDNKVGLTVEGEFLEHLEVGFKAPTSDVLVRVQAYNVTDLEIVEKAMTVGFDFSSESYGATSNIQQEVYDLKTATGMTFWKNRIVMWGVPKDPTILFLSDINDPSYFPYPNNITVFDEPIVCAKEFLDNLLVFTTNSVYQISLSSDGMSWNSTLVQSDLHIEPGDRQLIQIVRNMVFFKSGDYYYMLVPRAQSTTGKMVLAPVSNTILEFFNHFEVNVTNVLKDTFDYDGQFDLVNCFNFLDYEDIHNMYVFSFEDVKTGKSGYLHFDLLYNTVSRSWRIYTLELPYYLSSYRQDATKRGVLVTTSLIELNPTETSITEGRIGRCIQMFTFDGTLLKDTYLPKEVILDYDSTVTSEGITYDTALLLDSIKRHLPELEDKYRFPNWQFIDTGYRNFALERNKRYRELQFQLNNLEGTNLEFGLEFQIDGQKRMTYYEYEVEHVKDIDDPNYGMLYIQATPIMNLPVEGDVIPNDTNLGECSNAWVLDQSLFPEVSLWKVRTPVSGKGTAPRIRLLSRNSNRFELMNINWICRLMNMR